MWGKMKCSTKLLVPGIVVAMVAIALFVAQWLVGDFPMWLFAFPMNLLLGVLWLALVVEGYRRRTTSVAVQYLLSTEATYLALAISAVIAVVLGLQREPSTSSWPVVGGGLFVLTILTLVILRGWRNGGGVRWRFLVTHCGLWIALMAMFLGAPDKQIWRMQLSCTPSREAINERGESAFLDYELKLTDFKVERSEDGSPKRFNATIEVDGKVVDVEVNSPYSPKYGEDIYLVSYAPEGCVVQIVREPWKVVSAVGIAMLLLGAMMLFLQGFKR
jgi:hypothetical protein